MQLNPLNNPFTSADLKQLKKHGISLDKAIDQLNTLRAGIPHAILDRPCTIGDGIQVINKTDAEKYLMLFNRASSEGRVSKFIPASGAATRMFKELLTLYGKREEITLDGLRLIATDAGSALEFFENIERFAFYDELKASLDDDGYSIASLIKKGDLRIILKQLFAADKLNYALLPKGLIPFHRYTDHIRTPFDEQLYEASLLNLGGNVKTGVHFTLSEECFSQIEEHLKSAIEENQYSSLKVLLSTQKPSTDTIASDLEGNPFRNQDGSLLIRPSGHGALIENLNDFDGDIVLIKNIDNVVPEDRIADTIHYSKLLVGYLAELQDEIFSRIKQLTKPDVSSKDIDKIAEFCRERIAITLPEPDWNGWSITAKAEFLAGRLNRPLRVCGMVKNTGEPGGGPFWIKQKDSSVSQQIVETSQIDHDDSEQNKILGTSTHFNPVFIACGIRDYQGHPFNLLEFVDPETGFISTKSKDGKKLKALELPGLWNGSMAKWNTIFIEAPISILNPVKTVNDLLREEHR